MSTRPVMGMLKGKDDCPHERGHFDAWSVVLGVLLAIACGSIGWTIGHDSTQRARLGVCRQAIAAQASAEVLLAVCK